MPLPCDAGPSESLLPRSQKSLFVRSFTMVICTGLSPLFVRSHFGATVIDPNAHIGFPKCLVDCMPIFCTGCAKFAWDCLYVVGFLYFLCQAAGVMEAPAYMRFGDGRVREMSVWIWPVLSLAVLATAILSRSIL